MSEWSDHARFDTRPDIRTPQRAGFENERRETMSTDIRRHTMPVPTGATNGQIAECLADYIESEYHTTMRPDTDVRPASCSAALEDGRTVHAEIVGWDASGSRAIVHAAILPADEDDEPGQLAAITPRHALDLIHAHMSGEEWSADTLDEIAGVLLLAGYDLAEPDEEDDE